MKKYLHISLIIMMLLVFVTACKKNNSAAPKNYTNSVVDKTWWGLFTYTGKDEEYYSIHFNADNTLLWSEFSGDYTGKWVINTNELTITFDLSKLGMKAVISEDDKLLKIIGEPGNAQLNSGQPLINANSFLEKTDWEGAPLFTSNLYGLQIRFVSGSALDLQTTYFSPPSTYTSYLFQGNVYKRSATTQVIRAEISPGGAGANQRLFAIPISATEMKGSYKNYNVLWQASKK